MNFEEYLQGICFCGENQMILDDDQPDFFDNWLTDLQVDDWLQYGNDYLVHCLTLEKLGSVKPHNAV